MNNQTNLESVLREGGYSVTRQRLMVFDVLSHSKPLTMSRLIERLKGCMDRVSIYRAISLFETLGIVQRVNQGWKYGLELSDRFIGHHHHFTCVGCRKMISIDDHGLEQYIYRMAGKQSLTVTAHQIEIQGYCSACTDKSAVMTKTSNGKSRYKG